MFVFSSWILFGLIVLFYWKKICICKDCNRYIQTCWMPLRKSTSAPWRVLRRAQELAGQSGPICSHQMYFKVKSVLGMKSCWRRSQEEQNRVGLYTNSTMSFQSVRADMFIYLEVGYKWCIIDNNGWRRRKVYCMSQVQAQTNLRTKKQPCVNLIS